MTDSKTKSESKQAEPKPTFAVRSDNGTITSRRYHTFADCSKILRTDLEALEPVNEREIGLLGLKPCSACERRQSGGPAVEALTEIMLDVDANLQGEEQAAWFVIEALKDRGFYIAQRGVRKAE